MFHLFPCLEILEKMLNIANQSNTYFCRLMTVMSSRYNLILIGMMENILLQMLIEVSETFTLFTGNGFYLTFWYTSVVQLFL